MTGAADLLLTNAEIHTLADPDETHEAIAIRDGEIYRVGRAYDLAFLADAGTGTIDLDGRVVLPGFIDAHTHLEMVGRRLVHADLSTADSPADSISLLRESADSEPDLAVGSERDPEHGSENEHEWVLGYGYDESTWDDARLLMREDLDAVSETRPVVAFREDLHTAAVNSVVLDRLRSEMPNGNVRTDAGEPTGIVVEDALGPLFAATAPDREELRDLLRAATARAAELGITGVHEMVRRSAAPRVYRDLDSEGALPIRVRLNYWSDHVAALSEGGLRPNAGSEFVRVGAIKTYTDGSFGARTAKLTEPYADDAGVDTADADTDDTDDTGQWVVPPEELRALVRWADEESFQLAAHAIGDAAIGATLDAYEAETDTTSPETARHRVEHAELLDEELIERFEEVGAVASMQPNFLRWADEGGLYDERLGERRRRRTNRFLDLLRSDVPLAFGSDCMPFGPLYGIHRAVNAPAERQRLPVTDALRAYTSGAAYAGFDEHRLGTIEAGKKADLVVLPRSPWEIPEAIEAIDVSLTVVDGRIVHDGR